MCLHSDVIVPLLLPSNISITKTYIRDIRLLIRPSACLVCSDLFLLRIFVIDSSGNKMVPRAKIPLRHHQRFKIRLDYHQRLNPHQHLRPRLYHFTGNKIVPRAKIRLDYHQGLGRCPVYHSQRFGSLMVHKDACGKNDTGNKMVPRAKIRLRHYYRLYPRLSSHCHEILKH